MELNYFNRNKRDGNVRYNEMQTLYSFQKIARHFEPNHKNGFFLKAHRLLGKVRKEIRQLKTQKQMHNCESIIPKTYLHKSSNEGDKKYSNPDLPAENSKALFIQPSRRYNDYQIKFVFYPRINCYGSLRAFTSPWDSNL